MKNLVWLPSKYPSKCSESNQDLVQDCQLAKLFDSPIMSYFSCLAQMIFTFVDQNQKHLVLNLGLEPCER